MTFGLCNAPGTFQNYIKKSLKDYLDLWATAFLDDILIFSKTLQEHKDHVRKVVSRLPQHKLYLDIYKCEFHTKEMKYLGLLVGSEGIRINPGKVAAILDWQVSAKVKDVQSNHLQNLPKANKKSSPKKNPSYLPFKWSEACQKSFDLLKKTFTET